MYVLARKFGNDKISRKDGFSEVPQVFADEEMKNAQARHELFAQTNFLHSVKCDEKEIRKFWKWFYRTNLLKSFFMRIYHNGYYVN